MFRVRPETDDEDIGRTSERRADDGRIESERVVHVPRRWRPLKRRVATTETSGTSVPDVTRVDASS